MASCRRQDPERFFPIGYTGPAIVQLAAAKPVCAGCSVRDACLVVGPGCSVDHGVWGDLREEERRSLEDRTARGRINN
jgi:WhiB family redox-sensing transcriptional regulator